MKENFFWLVLERVFAIIDGLFVGALIARHLGTMEYGFLAYGGSIVAMLLPIVNLGADAVVVRHFVQEPTNRRQLLWTVLLTRTMVASIIVLLVAFVMALQSNESSTLSERLTVVALSTSLLGHAISSPRLLLEAQTNVKWSVWAALIAMAISVIIRVTLLYTDGSTTDFAIVPTLTMICSGVLTIASMFYLKALPRICLPNFHLIRALTRECWPLTIGALMVAIYMNLDVSMLRAMKDSSTAGVFSVAAQMSSAFYFVPTAFAASYFPILALAKEESFARYEQKLKRYLEINTALALGCFSLSMFAAPIVIEILYGDEFLASIAIFRIHLLALPFVFFGVARAQHLIIVKQHRFSLTVCGIGLATNLLLNLFLIPRYSAAGAAAATVASYFLSGFLISFFWSPTVPFGLLQIRSLACRSLWKGARAPT